MHTVLVRYFETLRNLLSDFQESQDNLEDSTEMQEALEMELIYIHLSFRILIDNLKVEFDDTFDWSMYVKTLIYTIFNVALVLIFLFIWRPFVNKLNS